MSYDPMTTAIPGVSVALQIVTPASGATVNSDGSNTMIINNAGLIAALTIAFPPSPVNGQRFVIGSRAAVTLLTLSATPAIYGGLSTLLAASYAQFVYAASVNAWFRVG